MSQQAIKRKFNVDLNDETVRKLFKQTIDDIERDLAKQKGLEKRQADYEKYLQSIRDGNVIVLHENKSEYFIDKLKEHVKDNDFVWKDIEYFTRVYAKFKGCTEKIKEVELEGNYPKWLDLPLEVNPEGGPDWAFSWKPCHDGEKTYSSSAMTYATAFYKPQNEFDHDGKVLDLDDMHEYDLKIVKTSDKIEYHLTEVVEEWCSRNPRKRVETKLKDFVYSPLV